MQEIRTSIERTAEIYGLLTAAGLILLFIIMKLIGLAHIVELRALNFFIMAAGIIKAEQSLKRKAADEFTYLNGLAMGVLTAIIATVVFALFVFIYTQFLDPAFMQYIIDNQPFGQYLNPYMVSVAIVIEGIGSGLILAFTVMNYMGTVKKK